MPAHCGNKIRGNAPEIFDNSQNLSFAPDALPGKNKLFSLSTLVPASGTSPVIPYIARNYIPPPPPPFFYFLSKFFPIIENQNAKAPPGDYSQYFRVGRGVLFIVIIKQKTP
jgi:hypothetical protein